MAEGKGIASRMVGWMDFGLWCLRFGVRRLARRKHALLQTPALRAAQLQTPKR